MSAICPSCLVERDPFVAHACGDTWTPSPNSEPTTKCCNSGSCSLGECSSSLPHSSDNCQCQTSAPSPESGDDPTTTPENVYSEGVLWDKLTIHPDSRGSVTETYRASWFPKVPPVKQLVRSESRAKTLRGMHLHKRQWDIWHFVSGSALVRLRYPSGENWIFRADAGEVTAIPPGVSHGFYTEEGCILLYALTEEYDGTDEFGWYPFDGLTEDSHPGWPRDHIGLIVSERDLRAPRLEDFEG